MEGSSAQTRREWCTTGAPRPTVSESKPNLPFNTPRDALHQTRYIFYTRLEKNATFYIVSLIQGSKDLLLFFITNPLLFLPLVTLFGEGSNNRFHTERH
ncbi:hypothetical protein FKM82_014882 [Ascaphus truei]